MIPPLRQGGGGTRAPALTYVATFGGVVVHVIVPGGGGFCDVVLSGFRLLWVGCFLSQGSVEPFNPQLAQAAKPAGRAEGRGVPGTWWLDCCGIRREETWQTWVDSSSHHCTGTWPSSIRVEGRSTCSVWHWRVVHSWALGRDMSGSRILGRSLVKVAADEQVNFLQHMQSDRFGFFSVVSSSPHR